jgi:hypothetical protein
MKILMVTVELTTQGSYILADVNPFSLHQVLEGMSSALEVAAFAAGLYSKGVEDWKLSDVRAGKVLDPIA